MTFCISDSLKQKLLPRRGLAGSARPVTARELAKLKQSLGQREPRRYRPGIEKGVQTSLEPELRPLREAAFRVLSELSVEGLAAADLEVLAVAERMLARLSWPSSLAGVVAGARGLADAVEVKKRAVRYRLDAASEGWMVEVYVVTGSGRAERREHSWLPLRQAVCSADEQAYAKAKERARAGFEELSADVRACLAYAFPDEPWADEVLREALADPAGRPADHGFLLSACSDPAVVRDFAQHSGAPHWLATCALDLAWGLREAVIPVLVQALPGLLEKPRYSPLLKTPPRQVALALGCFRTEAVARVLAGYAGSQVLAPQVAAFFQDAPELRGVLAEAGAPAAAQRLAGELGAAQKTGREDQPEAAAQVVPAVLRERAWRRPPKPVKAKVEIAGVRLPDSLPEHFELPEVDTTAAAEPVEARAMTRAELDQWRQQLAQGRYVPVDYQYARTGSGDRLELLRVPPAEGLSAWNAGQGYAWSESGLLAAHGLAALPGLIGPSRQWIRALDYEGSSQRLDLLQRCITPHVAPAWAQIAASRKQHRRAALSWLCEHAEIAALGLIPAAVGPRGKERDEAEAALLHLAWSGHAEAIRKATARYGTEVALAVAQLSERDPLVIDAKPPKPPSFLRVDELPPVLLRSGEQLPRDSREALLELLSLIAPEGRYAGLPAIVEACTPESLSAFVTALIDLWVRNDAPGRADWLLYAAVALPSEAAGRLVARLARQWARSSQVKAIRACHALALRGDDHALMHLGHIAETTRFAQLRSVARSLLEEVAARQKLSPDELADRTVPDLGLDEHGNLHLSYGRRPFVVSLDESLAIVVRDGTGARLRTLPPGKKTDDAAAVKAAKARFQAFKKDVDAIADRQIRRLEAAMVQGRSWPLEQARERLFVHPLARHLARGLVWRTDDGALCFRVAEDGTLADLDDVEVTVPASASVRIAHPLQIDVKRWAALFADYELLQPFEQLSRATYRLSAKQARSQEVADAAGVEVRAPKLLGLLEARGWRRDSAGHVGAFRRTAKSAGGGPVELHLPLSPGFEIAYLRDSDLQKLGAVTLHQDGVGIPFGRLDPIAYSELRRDLQALGAPGEPS